jgi:TRAP-type C4-dicarboxylate transport system permease large subunit
MSPTAIPGLPDNGVYAIRFVTLCMAGIVVALSVYVLLHYFTRRDENPEDRATSVRVVLAAFSYCLLSVVVALEVGDRMIAHTRLSYRAPIAFIAFVLGIMFLTKTLKVEFDKWRQRPPGRRR